MSTYSVRSPPWIHDRVSRRNVSTRERFGLGSARPSTAGRLLSAFQRRSLIVTLGDRPLPRNLKVVPDEIVFFTRRPVADPPGR